MVILNELILFYIKLMQTKLNNSSDYDVYYF